MTETLDSTAGAAETPEGSAAKAPKKRTGGLNSMLLADLKAMAGGMGIPGAGSMKKAALVDAIKAAQAGGGAPSQPAKAEQPKAEQPKGDQPKAEQPRGEQPKGDQAKGEQAKAEQAKAEQPRKADEQKADQKAEQKKGDEPKGEQPQQSRQQSSRQRGNQQGNQQGGQGNQQGQPKQGGQQGNQGNQQKAQPKQDEPRPADDDAHDDGDGADGEGGSRRNRRRRGRDRDRTTRAGREPDTEVREDDVLVPAAGILDVLDNYAFVRTSGYLAGVDDVYLSLSMVRKYGLRRGDAVVGQVRQPREGERREKFNPMVRIDTVNGVDPEQAKNRVEFDSLTPVSPTDRLRLETGPDAVVGRVIDLVTPVGKGQRGLVLAPSDAGKTATVQAIANAITANNPECHLMVVLIDERPEEVTDFQRAVKGEVVASTFDRPATDHTTLAELAIERAKRLVELGHDVVVLLDGLTRLGRAYNLTAPASGRVLPGGVDAAALYPPKKLFGAARNIDNGGSLTILATALVDGSKMDEAVLEELTGTDNLRLHLSRELADRGLVPAVDVHASGTRREDQLLTKEELAVLGSLRSELAGKDAAEALEQLLGMVRNSHTNYELLVRLQRG
ncbi:transcription termination factor Rho [Nocardioides aromaticivorans]|uniref:Transcription termination factor Rho n=1 Tax=Nocardioides aromaticivorans TaxID=200618 RepID=A0ABX7PIY5_9ACTN|nr:transcription termination factor Rho [Nocardioides aromaticivorans]QSR25924.1 transcription termination factor Rho [Nocardioides aromaticivorans]